MNTFLRIFLFAAVFIIICIIRRYLILLIFLELIMFISFLFYITLGSLLRSGFNFVYNLIFLVIIIFEGVFGLRLMVRLSRGEGRDFFVKW